MNKVLQATSRGQVTLPKAWRDKFDTSYFIAEVNANTITLTPLVTADFKEQAEQSWQQYQNGDFITHEDLMKKYGL